MSLGDTVLLGQLGSQLHNFRVFLLIAPLVDIKAASRLLTITAQLVKLVADSGVGGVAAVKGIGIALACQIANVDACKVDHAGQSHCQPEIVKDRIDLCRAGTFQNQACGFASVGLQYAVANKAPANPCNNGDFLDGLSHLDGRHQYIVSGLCAAHDLQQFHNIGGAKEVQANHVLRALRGFGNFVYIQG